MAVIRCANCDFEHEIQNRYSRESIDMYDHQKDVLRGVLACGKCKSESVFEMKDNSLTFLPGQIFTETVSKAVPKAASRLLHEATKCFYGTAYRAVPGMCRGSLEEALKDKKVKGGSLDEQLKNAPKSILDDDQKSLGHGARLFGRNALHRSMDIKPAQAQALLVITVGLLNHIAQQKPVPASQ